MDLNFLKISSLERHLDRRDSERPPLESEWEALLEKYKFMRADEFDIALMKYVDSMILDTEEILQQARNLQEQQRISALRGTFEDAWTAFNASFDDDEDKVVSEIVQGVKNSHEVVSLANLNETLRMLKELDRNKEAQELLSYFTEKHEKANYWTTDDPFSRAPLDSDVRAVVDQMKNAEPKDFNLEAALIAAARNYNADTISQLAAIPVETYYELMTTARGDRLNSIVLSGLEFKRISNASDEMKQVVRAMQEALRMAGRRSKLNALRLKKYGILE